MILPRTPQTLKWHLVVLYIVFPFILCCYCLLIARNSVCTFRPFLLSCVFALKNWGNSSFCCSTCNWHVGVFTYQWDKRMVNPEIQWSGMSQTPSKIKSILFLFSLSLSIYIYIYRWYAEPCLRLLRRLRSHWKWMKDRTVPAWTLLWYQLLFRS